MTDPRSDERNCEGMPVALVGEHEHPLKSAHRTFALAEEECDVPVAQAGIGCFGRTIGGSIRMASLLAFPIRPA